MNADSTPTAVTVSDRMKELVDVLLDAAYAYGRAHEEDKVSTYELLERVQDKILREIGWLETVREQDVKRIHALQEENAFLDKDRDRVYQENIALEDVIDQRGKRIQELDEEKERYKALCIEIEVIQRRCNVENARLSKLVGEAPSGWRATTVQRDPSEYRNMGDVDSAPADETRDGWFECRRCGQSVQPGAHTCPPQTRGEAMPEKAFPNVDVMWESYAEEYDRMQGRYRDADDVPPATISAMLSNAARAIRQLLLRAKEAESDRSRLLTALEEKENYIDGLLRRKRIDDELLDKLESAVVLQKEELEQKDAELLPLIPLARRRRS